MTQPSLIRKNFTVIAHRGASGDAPENTIAAVKKALELGVDMIEIDIRQTSDGVIVLMHDKTIDRTTTGKGRIDYITFEALKKHDAGSWYAKKFMEERVPSLEEIIALVDGKCKLLIEVKGNNKIYPGIERNVIDLIRKHKAEKWCIVQSFFSEVLENIHRLAPEIVTFKLVVSHLTLIRSYINIILKRTEAYEKFRTYAAINPNQNWISRRMVRQIHRYRQKVYCWTVDDPAKMEMVIKTGCDGIITNYPALLMKLLNKTGRNKEAII